MPELKPEDAQKLNEALGLVSPKIRNLQDVVHMLGGTSSEAVKQLTDLAGSLKKIKESGERSGIVLKAQASQLYKVAQATTKSTYASATLGNLLKKSPVDERMTMLGGAMAQLIQPSKAFTEMISFLRPSMLETAATGGTMIKDVGFSMAKFGLYALIFDTVMKALVGSAKNITNIFKEMSYGIGFAGASISGSTRLFGAFTTSAFLMGIKMEEFSTVFNALTASFAINQMNMARGGEEWLSSVGKSIAAFIGMAKVAGFSAEKTAELATTFGMLGKDMTQLPEVFAQFEDNVRRTALAPPMLASALAAIAPISMGSAHAADFLVKTLVGFRQAFHTSTDPILQFARENNRMRLMSDSMQEFAQATTKLSLPEMLAFGSKEPGLDLTGAIQEAIKGPEGGGRPAILLNYVMKVMEGVADSQQRVGVGTVLLSERFGIEMSKAYSLSELIASLTRQKMSMDQGDTKAMGQLMKDMSMGIDGVASAIQDPQEKIVLLLQKLVTMGITLLGFFGGGSSHLATTMREGTSSVRRGTQ